MDCSKAFEEAPAHRFLLPAILLPELRDGRRGGLNLEA
jgi:hypothetical protein